MSARKIMVLGEIGVGKSSLVRRLVHKTFEAVYNPTIGVDVYQYDVPPSETGEPVSLIVWDTDGNLGDAIFRHVYMKEAAAALIVGDATRRSTLDSMVTYASGFAEAMPGRFFGFAVNKIDLMRPGERPELPTALSRDANPLVETSALTGENVTHVFHEAARAILRRGQ
jgi:small GTP-binding protein